MEGDHVVRFLGNHRSRNVQPHIEFKGSGNPKGPLAEHMD